MLLCRLLSELPPGTAVVARNSAGALLFSLQGTGRTGKRFQEALNNHLKPEAGEEVVLQVPSRADHLHSFNLVLNTNFEEISAHSFCYFKVTTGG